MYLGQSDLYLSSGGGLVGGVGDVIVYSSIHSL